LKIVRVALLLIGAGLVGYAISDHPLYGSEPGFGKLQALIAVVGTLLAACALVPIRIAGRVLLLAITSLAMLALAELAGEIALGPRHRPIYQYDERLIFKFIPGRSSVMTRHMGNGGVTVAHRINSAGFRGPELMPAGQATRVMVYGDSFIHAFYSPQEETFVERLGSELASRLGRRFEVINAGVSSYGPDQIALKMEDDLPGLRPNLIVVAIFAGNDYGDLMRNKMFRLAPDGALLENRWTLDPAVRALLELNQRESILLRALRSIARTLRKAPAPPQGTGNLEFLLEEAEREYRSFVLDGDNMVTNTHVDHYSADVSLRPQSESARYKASLMEAVMRRIAEVAKRSNVALCFLFIPHPLDVAGGDAWGRVDRSRFPDYDARNQVAPLENAARALGMPYLSLFDVFRAGNADALYYRDGDDHWKAAGQALAAKAMADFLTIRGLLATRGTTSHSPAGDTFRR
jgi:hypothetical protein